MKLRTFISKRKELNDYLGELFTDAPRQETEPLSADKITDIFYHSMSTVWKNKMIEQGFNYAGFIVREMIDFHETRIEKLQPKEEKKKSSALSNNKLEKSKKRKMNDYDSSVSESSEYSSMEHKPMASK